MESSTAQFLLRQSACVQLPNKGAVCLECGKLLRVEEFPKMLDGQFPAGGSCVLLSPKWGLAGEVQVAVLCPADCVEGLP